MKFIILTVLFALSAHASEGTRGGGNTLGGLMVESYIVDPLSTAAGRQLEARLSVVKSKSPDLYALLEVGLQRPTWFFIPARLKELSGDVTGIPFGSTQTAIQQFENREIWIDKNSFVSLKTDEERAKLFAHESLLSELFSNYQPESSSDAVTRVVELKGYVRRLVSLIFSPRFSSMSNAEVSEQIRLARMRVDESGRVICRHGILEVGYGIPVGYHSPDQTCTDLIK